MLKKLLDSISNSRVRADVEHICSNFPNRLAGTDNCASMANYSASELEAAGLEVERKDILGLVSFPKPTKLNILGVNGTTLLANTLGHSADIKGCIKGELVYVGSGTEQECLAAGVKGKIILTELSYSPARQEKEQIAARLGAIGAVMFNWGHDSSEAIPMGSVKAVWGNPTQQDIVNKMPKIGCIGISRKDGLMLAELCKASRLDVEFKVNVSNEWAPVPITTAILYSPQPSDEYILVGGHQDGWYGEGATDNATGSGSILELARIFSKNRHILKRNIIFGFWAGHETGTMIASNWFAETNWDKLRGRIAAYLQIDQSGIVKSDRWNVTVSKGLFSFIDQIDSITHPGINRKCHQPVKSGDASFYGLGVPMLQAEGGFQDDKLALTAGASLGWWHHSLDCTIDKVDFDILHSHIGQYLRYLYGLVASPLLVHCLADEAQVIAQSLENYILPNDELNISAVKDLAVIFTETCQIFDQHMARIRSKQKFDEVETKIANNAVLAVNRHIIPITTTACDPYNQDSYGLTAQTENIPSFFAVKMLAKLSQEIPDQAIKYAILMVQLRRDRNRIMDALIDANNQLKGVLKKLSN